MQCTLQVFEHTNLSGAPVARIAVPKLSTFSVAPGSGRYVAAFVPEISGKPARVSIYQYPAVSTALASRSSFNAQEIVYRWSVHSCSIASAT